MIPAIFGMVFLELLSVAWIDLKSKKISNRWPLLNLIFAVLLYLFCRSTYVFTWELFVFPLGFLVIGFFLFLAKVMGAGDSKYLASLFLLIPTDYHVLFFEKIILTTIVVGSILLAYKLAKNFSELRAYVLTRYWDGIKRIIKSRFSYAPVILLAWILLGVDQWK